MRWKVTLREAAPPGTVTLRPLRLSDQHEWMHVRHTNHAWLEPWESTVPADAARDPAPSSYANYVRGLTKSARAGTCIPLVVELNGQIVGQVTVASISYGSLRNAAMGYWVSQQVAGRGIVPLAVAMAFDHCFDTLGMHRIELNVLPGNERSLRVVAKLGMRDEGVRQRFLHIAGAWRDHRTFALTTEELGPGTGRVVARVRGNPAT